MVSVGQGRYSGRRGGDMMATVQGEPGLGGADDRETEREEDQMKKSNG